MIQYKKITAPCFIILFNSTEGEVIGNLIRQSVNFPIQLLDLRKIDIFNKVFSELDYIFCTDVTSAYTLSVSLQKRATLIFWNSPYILEGKEELGSNEKQNAISKCFSALSFARNVICLTEPAREEIQLVHSRHIFHSVLPGSASEATLSLHQEGIIVLPDFHVLTQRKQLLNEFAQIGVLALTSDKRPNTTLPHLHITGAPLIELRPKILVYLGYDTEISVPLRLMDAYRNGSVIIQLDFGSGGEGRMLSSDCVGYFHVSSNSDSSLKTVRQFIEQLSTDDLFFSSILNAQRRYISGQNLHSASFIDVLLKK